MRKLGLFFFLLLWATLGWAQTPEPKEHNSSGFIIIGVIILIVIILMLFNRQKRRFND